MYANLILNNGYQVLENIELQTNAECTFYGSCQKGGGLLQFVNVVYRLLASFIITLLRREQIKRGLHRKSLLQKYRHKYEFSEL